MRIMNASHEHIHKYTLTSNGSLHGLKVLLNSRATMVDGHPEVGILPTGQGVGAIDDLPSCAELIDRMVAGATDALDRLCAPDPDGG